MNSFARWCGDAATVLAICVLTACGGGGGDAPARPQAPSIDVQPVSISVADGANATFSVHATGSQPQSYQWLRDGVAVPGANASSIALDPASLDDNGATFSVQVSNVAGSVASQAAALTVTPVAAHITTQPQSLAVTDGTTVTFSVGAAGTKSLSYQWYADDVAIAGATSASYVFAASYADSGKQITVVVANSYGTEKSAPAKLTVDPRAPSVASAPQDVNVKVGGTASFQVSFNGTGPLSYQWERSNDGGITWAPIAGATAQQFDVTGATLAWAGASLRVRGSNAVGSTVSGSAALKVTPNVHIIAGRVGGEGYADGQGTSVRFSQPWGTAVDASGNVFVADRFNRVIRRIASDGSVSTVAGRPRQGGQTDGPAAAAMFVFPAALALDPAGNLYVGDGPVIRKVAPNGTVSTLAGQWPSGSADGTGAAASFSDVQAIVSDASGNLVVVDAGQNQIVRKVSAKGVVTTLAGTAGVLGSQDGKGAAAQFSSLAAIALCADGNVYVADNETIRRVEPDGTVSLFAGTPNVYGTTDGPRLAALFGRVTGLGFDAAGNLYAGDGAYVRRIALDGTTTTLAGGGMSFGGDVDGAGAAAYMNSAVGMSLAPDGQRFVFASPTNSTVRAVTLAGAVATLAGVSPQYQHVDGPGAAARFFFVNNLTSDAAGNIYMPEGADFDIRRIDPSGTVSKLTLDQTSFVNMSAIALDGQGGFYVADWGLQQIARVASDGKVTVLAGVAASIGHNDGPGDQATFSFPAALAVDAAGNVYVADSQNGTIRKIDTGGMVTTVAGQAGQCINVDGVGIAARLCHPSGLAFDAQGRLYIADDWAHTIRRMDTTDGSVVTIGGAPFATGYSNGNVSRFNTPTALAFDAEGNLYIADGGNGVVRRMTPGGVTSTVMGQYGLMALQPGLGGAINRAVGLTVLPNGRVVVSSEQAIVGD